VIGDSEDEESEDNEDNAAAAAAAADDDDDDGDVDNDVVQTVSRTDATDTEPADVVAVDSDGSRNVESVQRNDDVTEQ